MKATASSRWCLLALFFVSSLHAENWPQWRGPNNDGISKEKNLLSKWSENENIAWKLKLPGMGSSTPAIWRDKIFLTSQEGDDLVLLGISTEGKELWKKKLGSRKKNYRGEGNDASASPSTDGKFVFATVATGNFGCFDFEGKEIWQVDLQERYGKFDIQFGMQSTPVLFKDRLYVQLIHSGGAKVACLQKDTGKEVWSIDRKSDGRAECEHSYASPCIWSKGDEAYLITHGNDYAIAHSLKDGSEIWRLGDLNGKTKRYDPTLRFVASPVATPDLIVVPTAKGGPVVGVKPSAMGTFGIGSDNELWRMTRDTPDVPSPLVHEGLVYLYRERGNLLCVDAKTGKTLYDERTQEGNHRASPVYADGKIYLTAQKGIITVVQPGPTFKILAENKLSDKFNASPAISNGRIYLRGWENLYAIGNPVD